MRACAPIGAVPRRHTRPISEQPLNLMKGHRADLRKRIAAFRRDAAIDQIEVYAVSAFASPGDTTRPDSSKIFSCALIISCALPGSSFNFSAVMSG